MSREDRAHWDQKWTADGSRRQVSELLLAHRDLLRGGVALDVACGLGQNAVWLAQRSYQVVGVDLSHVALRRAADAAESAGVSQRALFVQADLDQWAPAPSCADVVCVFRFLDRSLIPNLGRALRRGGLFFYATRHVGLLKRQPTATASYLLGRGELLRLFSGWAVISAREDAENAALVARKPS
jgi:SAM-dependent methyltransferase